MGIRAHCIQCKGEIEDTAEDNETLCYLCKTEEGLDCEHLYMVGDNICIYCGNEILDEQ